MIRTRPSKRALRTSPFSWLRELPRLGGESQLDRSWIDGGSFSVLQGVVTVEPPPDDPISRYVGFSLNDVTLTSFRIGSNDVILGFNHPYLEALSLAASPRQKWSALSSAFPVSIVFHGVSEIRIVRACDQGVFQHVRTRRGIDAKWFSYSSVRQLQVTRWSDDAKEVVLTAYASRPLREQPQEYEVLEDTYVVCICSRGIRVEQDLRNAWISALSNRTVEIFDAFDSIWPKPLWGCCDYENWMIESGNYKLLGWEWRPEWSR